MSKLYIYIYIYIYIYMCRSFIAQKEKGKSLIGQSKNSSYVLGNETSTHTHMYIYKCKAIPLQARCGPESG